VKSNALHRFNTALDMVETAEAKQVSRAASSLLFPELDFGTADNATYPSEDLPGVLARIAFDNEFVNAGAKAYQLARGDEVNVGAESRNPPARALLYDLRGLDEDAVDRQFYRVHLALALKELDVEFVMRALQTRKVQQFIADHDEDTFVAEYEMARSSSPTARTTVQLVVVPHRSREDDHF